MAKAGNLTKNSEVNSDVKSPQYYKYNQETQLDFYENIFVASFVFCHSILMAMGLLICTLFDSTSEGGRVRIDLYINNKTISLTDISLVGSSLPSLLLVTGFIIDIAVFTCFILYTQY